METTLSVIVVLLVEDDPGDVLLVREAFEFNKVHNELRVVSDGVDALDFLYRRNRHVNAPRPDLVPLDLNLPHKNGRELLTEIKADADLRAIPVVVLAGSEAEEDILRSYELGANAFVQASRLRSFHRGGPPHRQLLRGRREAATATDPRSVGLAAPAAPHAILDSSDAQLPSAWIRRRPWPVRLSL